jgi:hypothetical protein
MRSALEILTGKAAASREPRTACGCGGHCKESGAAGTAEPAGAFRFIAPIGTSDTPDRVAGRAAKKPWDYEICAVIPHLNTIEPLRVCIEVLRCQSLRPYLMILDTGSPPVEIHYLAAHGYRHSSEPVTAALDTAQTLCRSTLLFHTHADCFLRRRDFLEDLAARCNATTPVIGYRMSPRDWATDEWQWMVGHTATMLHMPTIHRIGATWSMQRMHHAFGYDWRNLGGWPDTETGFNHALRDAGITPVFIGDDRNGERQVDDNIDHVRSYAGSKTYSSHYHAKATDWMTAALREANERITAWRATS